MDSLRRRLARPRAAARVAVTAGVGLAAALGGGLLYVPAGVAAGSGPQAPLAYLLAGGGVCCLTVAFAVLASGPFGDRGPVYGPVARVWGSRRLGALAAWAALGGYVGLLALLTEWLGRLAPLPVGASAYVTGTTDAPTGLARLVGTAPSSPVVADGLAVLACGLALAVHLSGSRRAALAVAVPAWGIVLAVGGLLAAAFIPGVGEFVAGNYDPLYPTFRLQERPLWSLIGGIGTALFAFVGVEAAAYAVGWRETHPIDDEPDTETETPAATGTTETAAAPVVAAAIAGLLLALTAFVALGVVDWTRLTLADIPAAEAIGGYLPLDPVTLTTVVSTLAGLAALVALGVPAARTLAGLAELFPPLARGPAEPPVVPLVAVYAAAAALAATDFVATALYVAVPGLVVSYLAVAVTAAALPVRRPELWRGCSFRPSGRSAGLALAGALAVAATLLGVTLSADPATTLALTLHRVALAVFRFELVSDPLGGVVPAIVVWLSLGVGLSIVLRDYREAAGVELPPLEPADSSESKSKSESESGEDASTTEPEP